MKQEVRYPGHPLALDINSEFTPPVTELPLPVTKLPQLDSHPAQDIQVLTSLKRLHQRSESIQVTSKSTRTPSPPHKKFVPDNIFCSPEHEGLKEALRVGGTINMDIRQCEALSASRFQTN